MGVDAGPSVAERIDDCQYEAMVTTPALARHAPLPVDDADCTPAGPGLELPPADAEQLAVTLKALADPVRLRLFTWLVTSDEVCVCDFPDVGVSQPTVSHHLKKLRDAGLVDAERRGTWVHYRAVDGAHDQLGALLSMHSAPTM